MTNSQPISLVVYIMCNRKFIQFSMLYQDLPLVIDNYSGIINCIPVSFNKTAAYINMILFCRFTKLSACVPIGYWIAVLFGRGMCPTQIQYFRQKYHIGLVHRGFMYELFGVGKVFSFVPRFNIHLNNSQVKFFGRFCCLRIRNSSTPLC